MSDKDFVNSKNLSRLDLNKTAFEIDIYSYWCRIVYNKYKKWNDKSHSHSFWELHLCQTGECQIEIGGEKYVMNKNKFLLLPPKTVHTIIHQSGVRGSHVGILDICINDGKIVGFNDKNIENTGIIAPDKH